MSDAAQHPRPEVVDVVAGPAAASSVARVVAAVPEPRPEVLARVLAGLRDLPDQPVGREPLGGADRQAALAAETPLPRRRA